MQIITKEELKKLFLYYKKMVLMFCRDYAVQTDLFIRKNKTTIEIYLKIINTIFIFIVLLYVLSIKNIVKENLEQISVNMRMLHYSLMPAGLPSNQ